MTMEELTIETNKEESINCQCYPHCHCMKLGRRKKTIKRLGRRIDKSNLNPVFDQQKKIGLQSTQIGSLNIWLNSS